MMGRTILTRFAATVRARPAEVALRWRHDGSWHAWTWREYADQAARFAAGLRRLGLARGDRAVLLMHNRPEFHVADVGVMLAGGTPVSIFEASSPEQMQHVAGHARATVAVVEHGPALTRFLEIRRALPSLRQLIVVDAGDTALPPAAVRYDDVIAAPPVPLEAAAADVPPEAVLTVVYTSGTTGPPKGVLIAHAGACWWIDSVMRAFGDRYTMAGKRQLSYLPMAAMGERLATHYLHLASGTDVAICGDLARVHDYLREVRPHVFFGVPRVWEGLRAGVATALAASPRREAHVRRALAIGRRITAARSAARPVPPHLAAAWLVADALVLRQVRAALGLDRCDIALSGSAPIPVEVVEFFLALGVPLSETYGLTEATAVTMDLVHPRPGTAGRPIPGCEIRLARDGEILLSSGNLFRGYLDDPVRTAEAFDEQGWFRTGDIGSLDEQGYLRVVDRKKELIVTPDGRNVSPAHLESALKAACPLVAHACVLGDRRPHLAALLVLDAPSVSAWAARQGLSARPLADLLEHPDLRAEVAQGVARTNERLSSLEQVERFALLADDWRPGGDELTSTLKLRRHAILEKYAPLVESLYAAAPVVAGAGH
jgi:long-chain acyl-CoA synthetase